MHRIEAGNTSLGISLTPVGSADICIQTHPIAMTELSGDTSNHFEHDLQQPENAQ